MKRTSEPAFLASGSTSGQPVACFDASSIAHGADSMAGVRQALAGALEWVRAEFFKRMDGDPGAIVAVVTRPPGPGADDGLLFVAADGPLGGCGEATMFACATRSAGASSSVVFDTTSGPIHGVDSGSGSVTLRMPPVPGPPASHSVTIDGRPLAVRTVPVAGNTFAVVAAADAGLDLSATGRLTRRGDELLGEIAAAVSRKAAGSEQPPDMLLLTEPVAGGATRSAVIWGNAILNQGPCGTGTCARLVVALADGEIGPGSVLRHHSPFGPAFEAWTDAGHVMLRGQVDP
ncbi:proline racemase family protein [Nonomuraea sp. CA-143628]|uniref:proline racemase family protein n=1 Tax=Nonomuraea sp. CA-143628 TaxID=3239997 RepID=UPI003D8DD815